MSNVVFCLTSTHNKCTLCSRAIEAGEPVLIDSNDVSQKIYCYLHIVGNEQDLLVTRGFCYLPQHCQLFLARWVQMQHRSTATVKNAQQSVEEPQDMNQSGKRKIEGSKGSSSEVFGYHHSSNHGKRKISPSIQNCLLRRGTPTTHGQQTPTLTSPSPMKNPMLSYDSHRSLSFPGSVMTPVATQPNVPATLQQPYVSTSMWSYSQIQSDSQSSQKSDCTRQATQIQEPHQTSLHNAAGLGGNPMQSQLRRVCSLDACVSNASLSCPASVGSLFQLNNSAQPTSAQSPRLARLSSSNNEMLQPHPIPHKKYQPPAASWQAQTLHDAYAELKKQEQESVEQLSGLSTYLLHQESQSSIQSSMPSSGAQLPQSSQTSPCQLDKQSRSNHGLFLPLVSDYTTLQPETPLFTVPPVSTEGQERVSISSFVQEKSEACRDTDGCSSSLTSGQIASISASMPSQNGHDKQMALSEADSDVSVRTPPMRTVLPETVTDWRKYARSKSIKKDSVKTIKMVLKNLGMATTGKKRELIARLREEADSERTFEARMRAQHFMRRKVDPKNPEFSVRNEVEDTLMNLCEAASLETTPNLRLKEICRGLGLRISGAKSEIVARLRGYALYKAAHDAQSALTVASIESPQPLSAMMEPKRLSKSQSASTSSEA
eukprot:CFRG6770T1